MSKGEKMSLLLKSACLFCALSLFIASAVAAPWDKSDRIEYQMKKYDLKKLKTFSGTVEKIYEKVPSFGKRHNNAVGFHLVVKSDKDLYDVHIGPTWYYKTLDDLVAVGDQVEVLGTIKADVTNVDGSVKKYGVRAGEIRKGGEVVIRVRDAQGRPVWSGYVDPNE